MFFVYILYSLSTSKFYTGQTEDLKKRLQRHNKGLVNSTKNGAPWNIIWKGVKESRIEAVKLERSVKKRGAKRFLHDLGIEIDRI
ncbi:hypothetical protein GCM10009117_21370 [Gangjinia marincola]|uniref:GIY-YIG domain-containing protein n=1 Tax=Gangjinia marincola TaxID=578463 RepID=A0ABP3XUB5_9FLAO